VFVMAGRNGDSDSPMIFYSKAAAVASCHSSCKSAVCVPCHKLAITYKEGSTMSLKLCCH